MGIELSIADVFRMAGQLEQDASAFYREASSLSTDPRCRQLLAQLATMEDDHVHVFGGIKHHLAGRLRTGRDESPGEACPCSVDSLGMLAASAAGTLGRRFAGLPTNQDVLRKALDFERESIVFFLGLRSMLGRPADKKQVDAILLEELGHVVKLTSQLACGAGADRSGGDVH